MPDPVYADNWGRSGPGSVLAAGEGVSRVDRGVSWLSFSLVSVPGECLRKGSPKPGLAGKRGEGRGAGVGAGLGRPREEVCSPRLPRAWCLCLHLWNVADSLLGEPCAATAAALDLTSGG